MKKAVPLLLVLFASAPAFADEPECKSDYGVTVCGYHCVADYGQVKCAQTPEGLCHADYGQVVCWDPPERTYRRAQCISDYGQISCGYGCVADYGRVACASSPEDRCFAEDGRVVCTDEF